MQKINMFKWTYGLFGQNYRVARVDNYDMPKTSCLKWTYGRPSIKYRVASPFTRYLTAKGKIPDSFGLIGQF